MTGPFDMDFPDYREQVKAVWESNAQWWDDRIGDGNQYQQYLIEPPTQKLLELQAGEAVLDIACGAGRLARWMASRGARVTALDQSTRFIERARERERTQKRVSEEGQTEGPPIDYRLLDAADPEALLSLGEDRFDAAVCTMALMDMACVQPLITTLPRLLKKNGRLVFSLIHPVFSSGSARLFAEQIDRDGRLSRIAGVKITDYARLFVYRGEGIAGQPVPQYYFHRPLGLLLSGFFAAGWVLDGLVESTFPDELTARKGDSLSFLNLPALPPILVARLRAIKAGRA